MKKQRRERESSKYSSKNNDQSYHAENAGNLSIEEMIDGIRDKIQHALNEKARKIEENE